MIAIRAPVTTKVHCPTKIGPKCFCAVRDKHLFHISFNEALLIGAANSLFSENNPETIDSVRKSITNRPFLRISEKFRKENTETNQTKKTKKKQKKQKTKKPKKKKIWQLVYLQQYLARSLFFLFFCFFLVFLFFLVVFFFLFFLVFFFFFFFFWFFGFFGFASCLGFNPLYCLGSLC